MPWHKTPNALWLWERWTVDCAAGSNWHESTKGSFHWSRHKIRSSSGHLLDNTTLEICILIAETQLLVDFGWKPLFSLTPYRSTCQCLYSRCFSGSVLSEKDGNRALIGIEWHISDGQSSRAEQNRHVFDSDREIWQTLVVLLFRIVAPKFSIQVSISWAFLSAVLLKFRTSQNSTVEAFMGR